MRRFTITFPYRVIFREPHDQVIQGCQFDNGSVGFAWQPPYEGSRGISWADVGDTPAICQALLPFDTYHADTYRFEWLDDA